MHCKKAILSQLYIKIKLEEIYKMLVKNPKFEIYPDKKGEFRFRLKATNGQIIAVSEGYKTMKSCLNGVASVRKNAPDSPIVDPVPAEEK